MAVPLHGIRVLDLSRVLAGPWCTQILADLGAEVVKIERPGEGDETRHWGPPWLRDREGKETREAAYYLSCNRGKQSVTIDIGNPEGQALIHELAAVSDVFVENFKTGGLIGKKLDYASIREINPRIVYCSITGFGQSGPRATEAGYDYLIQGMAGLMSITGNADGEPGAGPQRVGVAVSDLTSGMYATIAILAALYHRVGSGKGQHIDLALMDTQVGWLANQALNYFIGGTVPVRTGAQHPNLAPYQPFRTKDGYVIVAIGNDGQFQRYCREVGCAQLAVDPRFRTNPDRIVNRKPLIEALEKGMLMRSSAEWIKALAAASVPCGPINSIEQAFNDPQVRHRGMKIELEHPLSGKVPGVANPIKFSETPLRYQKAPPLLGEDTERILTEVLRKTQGDIAALRVRRAI